MSSAPNRRWVLAQRPQGRITSETFVLEHTKMPEPADGEAVVRVAWLGIDATPRSWLNADAGYVDPIPLGEAMRGSGVGQIVTSRHPHLSPGDWVYGTMPWQDYALATDAGLFGVNVVPPGVDPKRMLTVYGVSGLTAYFGIHDVAQVSPGDAVLVTAAAGSVGSLAGQIARLRGGRVIGTAGGPAKVAWVRDVAGFDDCLDYKNDDLAAGLATFAPDGLNAVFDNVGGRVLEAALDNLADHARIALCGSISSGYTATGYGSGPRNYMQLGFRRASMRGFIFLDYVDQFPHALSDLVSWTHDGSLTWAEDVVAGLEHAPGALQGLFDGDNLGKRLVHVSQHA